jgi:hypothetical protein
MWLGPTTCFDTICVRNRDNTVPIHLLNTAPTLLDT